MIEKGTVFYDNVQRYFQVQLYGELVQRQYSRRPYWLAKDLRSLAEDLGRVRFKNGIPAHVQEAVCLLSKFESDCDPAVLKLAGQETKEAFDCYQRALIDSRSPKWLKDNFGKTYWYYFSSRK